MHISYNLIRAHWSSLSYWHSNFTLEYHADMIAHFHHHVEHSWHHHADILTRTPWNNLITSHRIFGVKNLIPSSFPSQFSSQLCITSAFHREYATPRALASSFISVRLSISNMPHPVDTIEKEPKRKKKEYRKKNGKRNEKRKGKGQEWYRK